MQTQHLGTVTGNARVTGIHLRYFRDSLQEKLRPGMDLRETGVVVSTGLMHLLKMEWRKKCSIQAESIAGSTAHVAQRMLELGRGTQAFAPWGGEQPTDFLPIMAMLWLAAHNAEHGVSARVTLDRLLPRAIDVALTEDTEMFRLMMIDTLHGLGQVGPLGGAIAVMVGHGPGGSDD
jgi:hypothetical protein